MTRYLRAEFVLPLTIVAAAAMVAVSEFMTTFEFTAGGEPQAVSLASDRHSYALLILAVLTVAGMAYAIVTGLRAVAAATAVLGLATLLLFLVLDLPDAGKAGPLDDDPGIYFADARAEPDAGFWLEAVGAVVLGLATVAFATLRSSQLRAWPDLIAARRARRAEAASASEDEPSKPKPGSRERKRSLREEPAAKRRKPASGEAAESRRPARKRPARERTRTVSEERAAARERLSRSSPNGKAKPRGKDDEEAGSEEDPGPSLMRRRAGGDA